MAGAGYGVQGRTQNIQGRILQRFGSISGVGMEDGCSGIRVTRREAPGGGGGNGAKSLAKMLLGPGSPIVWWEEAFHHQLWSVELKSWDLWCL